MNQGRLRVSVVITAGATVLALGACSTGGVGGGTNHVQALWYGKQKDGSIAQGITPVTVTAENVDGGSNFDVDLSGFESAAAGSYWNAAAWSAAAVATLATAADPRDVRIEFSVDEEIDGPSAGGLLTSAIRADLSDSSIPKDKTMTGTILPNGGIGPVGGIPAKLRAANAAKITTVMIPKGQSRAKDPESGEYVDTIEYGRQLGIDVKEVASTDEAYRLLGGEVVQQNTADPGPMDEDLLNVLKVKTNEILKRLEKARIAAAATPAMASQRAEIVKEVAVDRTRASAAVAAGNFVEAFASAGSAERAINAWNARSVAVSAGMRSGVAAATTELAAKAQESIPQIDQRINQASESKVEFQEQLIGLADALSWGTDALSRSTVVLGRLQSGNVSTAQELGAEAADLAESSYNSTVFLDTAVEANAAAGNVAVGDAAADSAFMNSYADFLAEAADANGRYFEEMAKSENAVALESDRAVIEAGRARWESVKNAQTQPQVIAKLSQAISRYIDSTVVIASVGVVAAADPSVSVSRVEISSPETIQAQVALATATTAKQSGLMTAKGLDSSYVRWSDSWGLAIADEDSGPLASDQLRQEGLVYQWFANLQAFIVQALHAKDA